MIRKIYVKYIALIALVAFMGACMCTKKNTWMGGTRSILEGLENSSYQDYTRGLKEKHLNWDVLDQGKMLTKMIANNEDVSEDAIFDFLKAQRARDDYYENDSSLIVDRIQRKIDRGDYVTPDELDQYRNYRLYNRKSNYYASNQYLDDYSIDEYNQRMSRVMPGIHSGRDLQPSSEEMRRGVSIDRAFNTSFSSSNDTPFGMRQDGMKASELSPSGAIEPFTLQNSPSNVNMATLNNPSFPNNTIDYDIPSHDDKYAIEGISRSQIPEGEEDKYILKSKIVPPVCPKCPTTCPKKKDECPPCPPCERCPEPNVECRRVSKYKIPEKDSKLKYPVPILTDFSQFGM